MGWCGNGPVMLWMRGRIMECGPSQSVASERVRAHHPAAATAPTRVSTPVTFTQKHNSPQSRDKGHFDCAALKLTKTCIFARELTRLFIPCTATPSESERGSTCSAIRRQTCSRLPLSSNSEEVIDLSSMNRPGPVVMRILNRMGLSSCALTCTTP